MLMQHIPAWMLPPEAPAGSSSSLRSALASGRDLLEALKAKQVRGLSVSIFFFFFSFFATFIFDPKY